LRLSFALTAPERAAKLAAALGPWPVSGAALQIGAKALADHAWRQSARGAVDRSARQLDSILTAAGLEIVGGTALFRLVSTPLAAELFRHLGEAGILVRRFYTVSSWLRFGLPADETARARLSAALGKFRRP
jgi:cobalamin biosynthetic protein CobC